MPGPKPRTFAAVAPHAPREDAFLEETLTVAEALKIARVRKATLLAEIHAGRILASQPGRRYLVSRRSLARWLASKPAGA